MLILDSFLVSLLGREIIKNMEQNFRQEAKFSNIS